MSNNTIENYLSDLMQFKSFIKKDLTTVSQSDIDNFIRHLNSMNRTPATANRKLQSIKTFFRFLMRESIIIKNPSEYIECARIPKRLPRVPETLDLLSIINRIDNKRDKLIFNILYCTGLRRFEIVKLKVNDINFIQGYLKTMGKGSKERIVPIHSNTLEQIREYIKEEDITNWLFPSVKNLGQCISCKRLNEIVQYWSQKVGIDGISPHRIRAHVATLLYKKGADIKAIQSILGHSSINTTNIYTKNDTERTMSEYAKAFN